jgi:hypothetical protein
MADTNYDYKRFMSALEGLAEGKQPTDKVGIKGDIRAISIAEGIAIGQTLSTPIHDDDLPIVDKPCAAVGIARTSALPRVIAEAIGKQLKE